MKFQRQHPRAAFLLAVVYKYADDFGGYQAALLTYYAFMSLFPLLLLGSTILGFSPRGDPHLQHDIVRSALGQFPVVGTQLNDPRHLGGGTIAWSSESSARCTAASVPLKCCSTR
jgi:uncharacterized BrkB/YihY/UPF0761 family membrane protein